MGKQSFSERYDIGCEECGNVDYAARKWDAIQLAKGHRKDGNGHIEYEDGRLYCEAEVRVWDRMSGPNRQHLVYLLPHAFAELMKG